jgi:hypothetical protein
MSLTSIPSRLVPTGGVTHGSEVLDIFATVAAAKVASRNDGEQCYVLATDTYYKCVTAGSAYTANDLDVLITGDGGATRWIGVAGRYIAGLTAKFYTNPDAAVPTYGAEIISNPDFASNANGWTLTGAEWHAANELWIYNNIISTVAVGAGGSNYQVGDVLGIIGDTLISPNTMTSYTTPAPYVVSATSYLSTSYPWQACDGSDGTTWVSNDVCSVTPQNLAIDIGQAALANKVGIVSSGGSYPTNSTIDGSNLEAPDKDNDAHWTTITANSGIADPGNHVEGTIVLAGNTTPYRHYRLHTTLATAGNSGRVGFREFKIYTEATTGTATVATLGAGNGVATVTITNRGRAYATGVHATTGGSGSGCTINITAVTQGNIAQTITLENGAPYLINLTLKDFLANWSFVGSGGLQNLGSEADFGQADHVTTKFSVYSVGATSGITLALTTNNSPTSIGKLSAASIKKITGFAAPNLTIADAVGSPAISFMGNTGVCSDFFVGPGAGASCVTTWDSTAGFGRIGIGYNALNKYLGRGGGMVAIGDYALDVNTTEAGTAVGNKCGKGATGFQPTIYGWNNSVDATCNYLVSYGANASSGAVGSRQLHLGFGAGILANGSDNIFIGTYACGANLTVSNCLIINPSIIATNFIYGIHDTSAYAGYLKLRGSLQPSVTSQFDLGTSSLIWNKSFINEVKALTKFGLTVAPIAPRAHVVDAAGGTEIATINAILATLEAFGFHAAA